MIDRTELDLRFDAHARMAQAMNGPSEKLEMVLPMPDTRADLATVLLFLAARLDHSRTLPRRESMQTAPANAA